MTTFSVRRSRLVLSGLAAGVSALLLGLSGLLDAAPTGIAISSQTASAFNSLPLTSVNTATPLVMLTLSRDHQLHYKAYNDYSDLNPEDGRGEIETTYRHSIRYYGYFDPTKCYRYDTASNVFQPATAGSADPAAPNATCSNQWSGNFLNWGTMTRMDAVRKLLYGGFRRVDDRTGTVLERDFLPTDAHSFAKYYNGADLPQVTPFTVDRVPSPVEYRFSESRPLVIAADGTLSGDGVVRNADGSHQIRIDDVELNRVFVGDQLRIERRGGATGTDPYLVGAVSEVSGDRITLVVFRGSVVNSGRLESAQITNLSRSGVSLCNLSNGLGASHFSTAPPLLRVARGNYELWGANERRQCQWREEYENLQSGFDGGFRSNGNRALQSGLNASAENPSREALGLGNGASRGEYIVRVQACVSGMIGSERCKSYDTSNASLAQKPIGLLQVYGDDDRIRFGLVTPSYQRNVSGGVLRKNAEAMSTEIDSSTGIFTGAAGIIRNLDRLRIFGYDYGNGTYLGDGCDFQRTGIAPGNSGSGNVVSEGNCSSWGNPLSEAYIESLRYLGGLQPTSSFSYGTDVSRDSTLGLTVSTWSDPLNATNYCASLNVLAFNASVTSYDNDQTSGLANLAGAPSITAQTRKLGDDEGITGRNWFIGSLGGGDDQLCTSKPIPDLSAANGICPEAASLQGAYGIAGAAYFARTNRIRSTLGGSNVVNVVPNNDLSSLKVTTYGVSLATNTPQIVVPVPGGGGRSVTILPVYRLDLGNNGVGGGAIVDFRIVSQTVDPATRIATGRFYINWEDSAQGGDYDQDVWGTISYVLNGNTNTIEITTDAVAQSTNQPQGFGYIVSGTTQDGPHFHSGIFNFQFTDPTSPTVRVNGGPPGGYINGSGGCNGCNLGDPPTTVTYALGSTSTGTLENPLYYAAKYGAFQDSNNDGTPDRPEEWDSRRADGSAGADRVPDTFFFVTNPNALEASLDSAFRSILARTASGTAASVVANARQGQGAVYQALYEPLRTDARNNQVAWIGTLQALFVDRAGNFREDGGTTPNGILDENDYATDPIVEIFYDAGTRSTRFRRYSGATRASSFQTFNSLSQLRTVWNARDRLSALTDDQAATQRSYTASAATGRYIFTFADHNLDGLPDTGEVLDFTPAALAITGEYGMLNVSSAAGAANVIRYVRGDSRVPNTRNRTLDYDGNSSTEVMRLGDIVNSSPIAVGPPAEAFDTIYGDQTYGAFARQYRNRRNVIYVGANDGLLHAFNGGFYNPATGGFGTQRNGNDVAHPLGSELWAYAPFNLLPHLNWLSDPNYGHIWYVDGAPRVFDARIFSPDAAHPGGWGTVMVVGMRMGGGAVNLQGVRSSNAAGFSNYTGLAANATELVTRSAYVVMDITNPEAPPRLLAEINHPSLGFTTVNPTVAVFSATGNASAPAGEKWYLVFGNGPQLSTLNGGAISPTQSARVFAFDLGTRAFAEGFGPRDLGTSGAASFLGDPVSVDWDLNFRTNSIYFGTSGGTTAAPTGRLFKLDFNPTNGQNAETPASSNWSTGVLLDTARPILAAPSLTTDEQGRRWVLTGTGRFLVSADKASTSQQLLFGVIDRPPGGSAVTLGDLVDTTNAVVMTNGTITGVAGATTETELTELAATRGGWRFDLDAISGSSAERSVNRTALLDGVLFDTSYTPSTTLCAGEGSSRLIGFNFRTGTPRAATPVFGASSSFVVNNSVDLGSGLGTAPTLHIDSVISAIGGNGGNGGNTGGGTGGSTGGDGGGAGSVSGSLTCPGGLTINVQTSTGAIVQQCANVTGGIRSGEIDWRETHPNSGPSGP